MHIDLKPQSTPFSEHLTSVFHAILLVMVGCMTLGAMLHIAARMV